MSDGILPDEGCHGQGSDLFFSSYLKSPVPAGGDSSNSSNSIPCVPVAHDYSMAAVGGVSSGDMFLNSSVTNFYFPSTIGGGAAAVGDGSLTGAYSAAFLPMVASALATNISSDSSAALGSASAFASDKAAGGGDVDDLRRRKRRAGSSNSESGNTHTSTGSESDKSPAMDMDVIRERNRISASKYRKKQKMLAVS
jgi:hypothetical protein